MKNKLSQWLVVLLLASGSTNLAYASNHHKHKKNLHHKKNHTTNNYMVGTASYYGDHDGFQGRLMADGKRFDTNDIYSAAHPTLPLGTKLSVTNLANGRTIYVEVRDRMPKEHRVIDLSVAAAKALGMRHKGLATVKLVKVSEKEFEQNKRYLQVEDNDSGIPS